MNCFTHIWRYCLQRLLIHVCVIHNMKEKKIRNIFEKTLEKTIKNAVSFNWFIMIVVVVAFHVQLKQSHICTTNLPEKHFGLNGTNSVKNYDWLIWTKSSQRRPCFGALFKLTFRCTRFNYIGIGSHCEPWRFKF